MDPVYDYVALQLWPWMRVALRWQIEGKENIPSRGPALLASNHISYLDPLVAAYTALQRRRRARFLAKAELFRPPVSWVLQSMGQIKVERGGDRAADSLVHAAEALQKGELVVIFPEGTISHETFEPMRFKTGVARVMQQADVPAIPMAIWGPHRILTKGRSPAPRLGVEARVSIGAPVHPIEGETPADLAARVREAVVGELRVAQSAYSQQPAAGEDDWWVARPPLTVAGKAGKPGKAGRKSS